jgi:hypothetical protein
LVKEIASSGADLFQQVGAKVADVTGCFNGKDSAANTVAVPVILIILHTVIVAVFMVL